MSWNMCVRGLSFSKASTSTTTVCSTCREMWALPSTFLIADFMRPTRHSQKPPNYGILFGMNFQVTPLQFSIALTSSDEDRVFSSSAADWKVVALSEIISWGVDLHHAKWQEASRNVSVDKSATTSRCMALLVAQVNKHTYTLVSSSLWWTYRAPVKSTPVTEKGRASCILTLGSGTGSEAMYGLPECFLQTTHQWRRDCLAVGIQ